ncbi:Rhodanese-related sulfurtransferase [Olavius algarvensis Delta 1 endosymbiont]|nr:Rhodanese-related sulfurtransferase [Olavius algarvensis Delta 1 endosymbiont]
MRFQKLSAASLILCLALVLGIGCAGTALASDTAKAGQSSDWKFHDIVEVAFVQQYAKLPQPEGVMIIDSRPYKPKYAKGHIPTAVSLPHSQFDKMTDKLAAEKKALLIFYCGGPT